VDGVVAAGNDIRSTVTGIPRPLPPELDVVAFRILQEMLTNALKHGRRGEPITVERRWGNDDLRIMVHNVVADDAAGDPSPGSTSDPGEGIGQLGMRRRLESVGGRLEVAQRATDHGRTFTATAWVPLRPRVEA
jgi:signal transduction histidine kinase